MTSQEAQAYFEEHGFYPAKADSRPPRPSRLERSGRSTTNARGQRHGQGRLALKGWRAPLHWTVPPAFEKPGRIVEMIGYEDYMAAVKEYYEIFGRLRVAEAERLHDRWAIKQVLKHFETHVRGFRGQSVGRNGAIFGRASGTEKWGEGRRVVYQDILTSPEKLVENGRLIVDLRYILRAYGVHNLPAAERLVRLRLSQTWGVKVA